MSLLFPRPGERRMQQPGVSAIMARAAATNGVYVDQDSAMRHDAVWGCVTRISQDVAMMPVDVVRYVNGQRQEVSPAPQIIAAPSVLAAPLDWRYQVVASWLTAGNAWGKVTDTTANGMYPTRIELLSPAQVQVRHGAFFVDNVEMALWPVGPLWHVPAYTMPGYQLGLSPIAYHAASIGLGLTAQKFGGDYLAAGGPTALIQPEGALNEAQAITLKQRFLNLTTGSREPIVLPSTTKYTPLTINPQESQFLSTMRYTAEQIIGRIYLEDPADYGLAATGSGSLKYQNIGSEALARFKRRQFWVTKLQAALSALTPPDVVVKLNTSSALMMTAKERAEVHGLRLEHRTRTINEVRAIEDEPPFGAEFDVPGIPPLSTAPAAPAAGDPTPTPAA